MDLQAAWARYDGPVELFLVYTAGILVYSLLAAGCYGFLSRRDMFGGRRAASATSTVASGFGYVAVFPLVSFAFFLLLAGSLLFFNPDMDPERAFTISMAIVAAVRACSYVHEATAHELAKLMPLGLLGVFLVLSDFQNLAESFGALKALVDQADVVGVFFAIVVVLEFLMRAVFAMSRPARRRTAVHTGFATRPGPASPPASPGAASFRRR